MTPYSNCVDGCCCLDLDLDPDQSTGSVLSNQIDFILVVVEVIQQLIVTFRAGGKLKQLPIKKLSITWPKRLRFGSVAAGVRSVRLDSRPELMNSNLGAFTKPLKRLPDQT